MKLIDAFIFYNEFDILHYRLNILKEHVDYFIIVESSHTFSGKEKRLYFNEIKIKPYKLEEIISHLYSINKEIQAKEVSLLKSIT